jgi:hypothetical protein
MMKLVSALLLALAMSASSFISASPLDDLASPEQSVRDKAAAVQRTTFQSTPESKWTPVIDKITKGLSKKEVLNILLPFKVTEGGGAGGGGSYSNSFRLDDEWILTCWFTNDDDILFERQLSQSLKAVGALLPDKGFTGRWVTYFPNGNKSYESDLKNGKNIGDFIAYYSSGSKCYVQHHTEKGIDGDETGYHPSGKVAYRGQYKDGKRIGTWTWYDEEGKITSTRDQPNP